MRDKNLALEEYVDYIRGFVYRKKHLRIQKGTQEMEVFYIPAGDEEEMLPIPADRYNKILAVNRLKYIC